jgi:hypothetical protein
MYLIIFPPLQHSHICLSNHNSQTIGMHVKFPHSDNLGHNWLRLFPPTENSHIFMINLNHMHVTLLKPPLPQLNVELVSWYITKSCIISALFTTLNWGQWRKSWRPSPPPPSGKLTNFRKFWSKRGLKTVFSSANGGVCRKFEGEGKTKFVLSMFNI